MEYFKSNSVSVFPTTGRNINIDPQSMFNTEKNLTSIVNRLTHQKSFIVEGTVKIENNVPKVYNGVVNISGYLFKLSSDSYNTTDGSTPSSNNYLIMSINIENVDGYERLVGTDTSDNPSESVYNGIQLKYVTSLPTVGDYLVLAKKENDTWKIPKSSLTPFDTTQILFSNSTAANSYEESLYDFLLNDYVVDDGNL